MLKHTVCAHSDKTVWSPANQIRYANMLKRESHKET